MTDNPQSDYGFLSILPISEAVSKSLVQHFRRLELGNSQTYQTPLVKKTITSVEILQGWDLIYNSKKGSCVNAVLDSLETSNRDKFGSRSIAKPWNDRIKSVEEYFEMRSSNLYRLHGILDSDFCKANPRLRPISLTKAMSYLKDSTNSGLPFFTKKGKVKHQLTLNFDEIPNDLPCILFTRTQEGNKTRNVWGYPMKLTLLETQFYQPLLDYQRRYAYWRGAILSPDETERRVSRIMNLSKRNPGKYTIISMDFSRFDASIQPFMINLAFDYIKGLFQEEFSPAIEMLKSLFMTVPLLTPSGIFRGTHGVPSGSTFTNEVDSLVQYLIAMSTNLILENHFQIQGDDGVYLVKTEDVDKFVNYFIYQGLIVNKEKTHFAEDYAIYCQNLYHPDYSDGNGIYYGVYSTYRALNRLVHQERWVNFKAYGIMGLDYYSLRAISILENCKHHPLFEDLVRYVLKLDKTKLHYNPESFGKYCQLLKEGKGSGWVHGNQYGDDLKGIHNFATVKLIKRLLDEDEFKTLE